MAILEKETVFTDDIRPVPASELEERLERFRTAMEKRYPGWEMVALNHKVAMYYFTGTMQEGVLIIRPQDAICGCAAATTEPARNRILMISALCTALGKRQTFMGRRHASCIWKSSVHLWIGSGCCISILLLKKSLGLMLFYRICGWLKANTSWNDGY